MLIMISHGLELRTNCTSTRICIRDAMNKQSFSNYHWQTLKTEDVQEAIYTLKTSISKPKFEALVDLNIKLKSN